MKLLCVMIFVFASVTAFAQDARVSGPCDQLEARVADKTLREFSPSAWDRALEGMEVEIKVAAAEFLANHPEILKLSPAQIEPQDAPQTWHRSRWDEVLSGLESDISAAADDYVVESKHSVADYLDEIRKCRAGVR